MRLFIVVILFTNVSLYASIFPTYNGARVTGLSNTVVSNNNHWSLYSNPALLSQSQESSVGISVKNRFGVSDLNSAAFGSNFKTKQGHFGMAFSHYGITDFNRQNVCLGFGRQFSDFFIGASGHYLNTQISNSSTSSALFLNIGLAFNFSSNFMVSLSAQNINRARFNKIPEARLESNYILGIKYEASKELNLFVEVDHGLELENTIGKFALEYLLSDDFFVLAGAATDEDVFSFGLFYVNSKWDGGMALNYNQYLGFSPTLSVSYKI